MEQRRPKTVVVADPDEAFRREISDVLVAQGQKTLTTDNGHRAIELLEEFDGNIDFLVINHQIPPIDSYWVLQWVKDKRYNEKFNVIVVSSTEEPDYVIKELMGSGVKAFITKDISAAQIVYVMNQIYFRSTQTDLTRTLSRPRIPVSIAVEFTYNNRSSSGHVTDISESGLHLHTLGKLKLGTEVSMNLTLTGTEKPIVVKGKVERANKVGRRDTTFKGVGVSITEVSPDDMNKIREFLKERAYMLGLP